jgi:hypothetical protein
MADIDDYDKVYAGFTVGAGGALRFGSQKQHGFDVDINVPLRTPDFWSDYNEMENDPRLDVAVGPLPVGVSFGYHFEF